MSKSKPKSIRDFHFDYIASLFLDWYTAEQLFSKGDTIEILVETTRHFFGNLFHVFQDRITLTIAKLLDSATVNGYQTASFHSAILELNLPKTDARFRSIWTKYSQLKKDCEKIIEFRHRQLAHIDHAIAMQKEFITNISYSRMGRIIQQIGELANEISVVAGEGTVAYEITAEQTDVPMLLDCIQKRNTEIAKTYHRR